MKTCCLLILLVGIVCAMPDEVQLKNGKILKNCKVISQTDSVYFVESSFGRLSFNVKDVLRIDYNDYDKSKKSLFVGDIVKSLDTMTFENKKPVQQITTYPRIGLISLSLIAGIGTYYFIDKAMDYGSANAILNEWGFNSEELKSKKNTYTYLAVGSGILTVVFTAIALKPDFIEIKNNSLNLKLKF